MQSITEVVVVFSYEDGLETFYTYLLVLNIVNVVPLICLTTSISFKYSVLVLFWLFRKLCKTQRYVLFHLGLNLARLHLRIKLKAHGMFPVRYS